MNITQDDHEDIIAIQFDNDIYFGQEARNKAIELKTFTSLHPRSTFKFMAAMDLDPRWAKYASYPTIFTMKKYREFKNE